MILLDTDMLSAVAKIARLPLLFSLRQTTRLYITPGVFGGLTHSFNLAREYALVGTTPSVICRLEDTDNPLPIAPARSRQATFDWVAKAPAIAHGLSAYPAGESAARPYRYATFQSALVSALTV